MLKQLCKVGSTSFVKREGRESGGLLQAVQYQHYGRYHGILLCLEQKDIFYLP